MMKKFEIKMFDVNSKVRTLIIEGESTDDALDKIIEVMADTNDEYSKWVSSIDSRIINLNNIVEITSIEEVEG
ncbi:hypothetical protein [Dellaglioa algida]|uniref:hypothetical protein n=1 Tax=Dellaglioa algida TaxID=105612 RepID=UPI0024C48D53|nr:hypothetical protein [Dellaglioa algida]MDK1716393.1 hypothetical protein [Dellaglioa algida]MDK1720253.1 hypothetical protein [Dellaglioa algida]MDK1721334.1 hypothetical protein [Dellaglioa algida]